MGKRWSKIGKSMIRVIFCLGRLSKLLYPCFYLDLDEKRVSCSGFVSFQNNQVSSPILISISTPNKQEQNYLLHKSEFYDQLLATVEK